MSNTLTALIPDFYRALDVVSRELSGFIPAVTLDAGTARAAVGQTVRSPVTAVGTAEDITPGSIPPDTGDQTIGNEPITIAKSRAVPFRWTGEEQLGLNNNGPGYLSIRQNQIAQAIRVLVNEIEVFIGVTAYKRASRAFGTAGTAPFGSTPGIGDLADVMKILLDNGAPTSDLQCVFNTTAGANLRKITNLYKANEAGTDSLLRQGVLADLYGFALRESAGVAAVTKGTGTGYLVNNAAGIAVNDTSIATDTGSGTLLAGDIITTASDTNKYVVRTALAAGTFVINPPGARKTSADNDAITIGNNYAANMAFHRSSIILATRPPAIPEEGDSADDSMLVTDPRTGLTFELRMYKQYRRIRYEVCLAYGCANIKSEHSAILLG